MNIKKLILILLVTAIGLITQGCTAVILGTGTLGNINSNLSSLGAPMQFSRSVLNAYSGQVLDLGPYVVGGLPPYTFALTSASGTGTISGSMYTAPTSYFGNGAITVTDSQNATAKATMSIVGNPMLWLDASGITGLSSGASVTAWNDLSGNGRTFSQSTSANRPTYKTNIVNNLPVVRFSNTLSQFMTQNSGTALNLTGGGGTTGFIVAKISGSTVTNANVFLSKGTGDLALVAFGAIPSFGLVKSAVSNPSTVVSQSTGIPSGFNILYYTFTGTVGKIYENGGSVANGISDPLASLTTGLTFSNNGIATTTLGMDPNATSGSTLTGDIAELVIFPSILTTQQIQVTVGYLAAKYGPITPYNWSYFSSLYSNPGLNATTNKFTVPSNGATTTITASVIGAGGSGTTNSGVGAGGGGGGGYASTVIQVSPSQVYNVTVGSSGAGPGTGGDTIVALGAGTALITGGGGTNGSGQGAGAGGTGSSTIPATTRNGAYAGNGSNFYLGGGGGGGGAAGYSASGLGGNGGYACGGNYPAGGTGGNGSGGAGGTGSGNVNGCPNYNGSGVGTAAPAYSSNLSTFVLEGGGGGGGGGQASNNYYGASGGFPGGGGGGSNQSGGCCNGGGAGANGAALVEFLVWQ